MSSEDLKNQIADAKANVNSEERQLDALNKANEVWENEDIHTKKAHYEQLEHLRDLSKAARLRLEQLEHGVEDIQRQYHENIAMSTQEATHIITPNIQDLDPKASVRDRFATQLQRNPNLQSRSAFFSLVFQSLVTDILQTGTAVSQEWLCAHEFPLELINLRD